MKELSDIQENSTAKELAKLIKANPENKDICQQVARHPNTSPEVLKELFKKYPADVLNNPIIDLLLLENPNLFCELYETNPNCFNTKDLPIFYLEWAANNLDRRIRESLAYGLSTPTFILKKLASDNNNLVRSLVAKNSNLTEEIIDRLLKDKDDLVLCNLARNKKTSHHPILELLAKHNSIDVRRAVAENSNTLDYLLEKLSQDKDLAVVSNVAGNHNTSRDVLKQLSQHNYSSIRSIVADNTKTPDYVLEKLSEDEDIDIVLNVARNSRTPLEVLEKLSKHQYIYVRHSVGENCYISLNLMKQLIKDREKFVKFFSDKLFRLERLAEKIKHRDNLILIAKAINANISLTLRKNLLTSDREPNQLNSLETNYFKYISKHIDLIKRNRLYWSTGMENDYLLKTYGKKSRLHLTDLELIEFWEYLADLSITNLDL